MPPKKQQTKAPKPKSLHQVVADVGLYPTEAYEFVQAGLSYTVQRVHSQITDPKASRHVSGQQLCQGLRDFALIQWGMMARVVLRHWNITATVDFGRIVFAMIDAGHMQKTDEDSLDDFKNVYDFRTAFEGYRIPAAALVAS